MLTIDRCPSRAVMQRGHMDSQVSLAHRERRFSEQNLVRRILIAWSAAVDCAEVL
jgi:hypothetical protein